MHSDVVLVGKAFIGHTSSISAVTKNAKSWFSNAELFMYANFVLKSTFAKIGTVPLPILELLQLFLGFLENPLTLFLVLILR